MTTGAEDVDAYIASFPAETRTVLQELRRRVHAIAPTATDGISYGIMTFKVDGKVLVHVGGFKQHVSMYPVPQTDDASLTADIEKYQVSKGTLKFPLKDDIPYGFAERITQAHLDRLAG